MLVDGYFRVGRLAGVDLRLHWSVPVGALVFGSLRFEPVLWLAFLAVVGVHELGHAVLIKTVLNPAEGNRITGIDVTGYGGQCRFRGRADALEHALIAWGGVLAQAVLLIGTLLVVSVVRSRHEPHGFARRTRVHRDQPLDRRNQSAALCAARRRARLAAFSRAPLARLDVGAARGLPALALGRAAAAGACRARGAELARAELRTSKAPPPLRRARPVPAVSEAADAERASADDELIEKPSAQAQRELAALLERIGDEAGRAKKRR